MQINMVPSLIVDRETPPFLFESTVSITVKQLVMYLMQYAKSVYYE